MFSLTTQKADVWAPAAILNFILSLSGHLIFADFWTRRRSVRQHEMDLNRHRVSRMNFATAPVLTIDPEDPVDHSIRLPSAFVQVILNLSEIPRHYPLFR